MSAVSLILSGYMAVVSSKPIKDSDSLSKKLYPHCSKPVGHRNGFQRDLTIMIK